MFARSSSRGVLLTVVVGCLLLFAGAIAPEDRAGASASMLATAGVSGDRQAGPWTAPAGVTIPGPQLAGRLTAGRAVTVTGSRPASPATSGLAQLGDRVDAPNSTSAGPGDHLAVGRAIANPWPAGAEALPLERVRKVAVSAPRAMLVPRAPPAS